MPSIFNLKGAFTESKSTDNLTFFSSTGGQGTYEEYFDEIIYEVPAGKRAKVVMRLDSPDTVGGSNRTGISVQQGYEFNISVSGLAYFYIGQHLIATASAAAQGTTSYVHDHAGFVPLPHVPNYMVRGGSAYDAHLVDFYKDPLNALPAYIIPCPSYFYLLEGEKVRGYCRHNLYSNDGVNQYSMSVITSVSYDLEIIEEDDL